MGASLQIVCPITPQAPTADPGHISWLLTLIQIFLQCQMCAEKIKTTANTKFLLLPWKEGFFYQEIPFIASAGLMLSSLISKPGWKPIISVIPGKHLMYNNSEKLTLHLFSGLFFFLPVKLKTSYKPALLEMLSCKWSLIYKWRFLFIKNQEKVF